MAEERPKQKKEIALQGKWISDLDGIAVAENFTAMKNFRYTDAYPSGVKGMSNQNPNLQLTATIIKNAFHYRKKVPDEQYLLVQHETAAGTGKVISALESTVPSPFTGKTDTSLNASAATGYFSKAPGGAVVFCDSEETLIWGGNEFKAGSFINFDPAGTFTYDYTDRVNNTLQDAANTATIYVPGTNAATMYIGTTRPLSGFKVYIKTANTLVGTLEVACWSSGTWTSVTSLVDGTVGLTATGVVTFATASGAAELVMLNGAYLYWYYITMPLCANLSIYQVTLRAPWEAITDVWDGVERSIAAFIRLNGSDYIDDTVNVFENSYDSNNDMTYSDMSTIDATNYYLVGFTERMVGLHLYLPSNQVNTTAIVLSGYYWSGSAWVALGSLADATDTGGIALNHSGIISWDDCGEANEQQVTILTTIPLFYYKFKYSGSLVGAPYVYYATGIPSPKTIKPYKFPIYALDRVMLCNSTKDYPNKVLVGAQTSNCVFNGDDSAELFIGDENALTGGAWLYSQFGSSLYNVVAFTKVSETWIMSGNDPSNWTVYRVSSNLGCPAPRTICVINAPYELYQQSNRTIAIWQAANGIYIFDGKGFTPIHGDIENYFDPNNSSGINQSKIGDSVAFYDEALQEYHWLFASGISATLDKEFVFDLRRRKWFEIARTGKELQHGVCLEDLYGNTHTYGFDNGGYIYRLEFGQTWDGTTVARRLTTGDISLAGGSVWLQTRVRNMKLVCGVTGDNSTDITLNHYGDTSSVATAFTDSEQPKSTERVTHCKWSCNLMPHVFHKFDINITTGSGVTKFDPIYFAVMYEVVREDTRGDI